MNHISIQNIYKSFFIILALTVNLDLQEGTGCLNLLFQSLHSLNPISVLFMILLIQILGYSDKIKAETAASKTEHLFCNIPAAFFSFCMIFGYSFYKSNSWDLVFGSLLQMLKSFIAFTGYYYLFQSVIFYIFYAADNLQLQSYNKMKLPRIIESYLKYMEKYPFRTVFYTMVIWILPYIFISYPGIFTCDTKIQLNNGYCALFQGTSRLKNQHPVVHTLLLVFSTILGKTLFSNANTGIFLLSLAQTLFTIAAVAWTVKYLIQCGISSQYSALVLIFFMLNPRIQNYLFVLVKDTWYAPFMMIFTVEFHRILTRKYLTGQDPKKYLSVLIFSMIGIFFFRQDGVYVLLLTTLAAGIFHRKNRRLFLYLFTVTFLFSIIYQHCILPACNINNNNTRQMFSIPFQQTARYLRDAGNDITDEEADIISNVLDYEHLSELYNPNLSDPVKSTFNKDAASKEIIAYLSVWMKMFFRHPDIYIQATMNNLYGYFYPDGYTTLILDYGSSQEYMEQCNADNPELNLQLGYPQKNSVLREKMEYLREMIFQLPVLSACNLSATYIWILILLIFYALRKKNKINLLLLLPSFVVFLICMAGPTYGWYFRYMYSIVMCLPAICLLSLIHNEYTRN